MQGKLEIDKLTKDKIKKMLLVTIDKNLEHAIEFAMIILDCSKSDERFKLYDIITALSINDIDFAKRKILELN